jgi:hypothetical protein
VVSQSSTDAVSYEDWARQMNLCKAAITHATRAEDKREHRLGFRHLVAGGTRAALQFLGTIAHGQDWLVGDTEEAGDKALEEFKDDCGETMATLRSQVGEFQGSFDEYLAERNMLLRRDELRAKEVERLERSLTASQLVVADCKRDNRELVAKLAVSEAQCKLAVSELAARPIPPPGTAAPPPHPIPTTLPVPVATSSTSLKSSRSESEVVASPRSVMAVRQFIQDVLAELSRYIPQPLRKKLARHMKVWIVDDEEEHGLPAGLSQVFLPLEDSHPTEAPLTVFASLLPRPPHPT